VQVKSTGKQRSSKENFFTAIFMCSLMGTAWVFGFFQLVADTSDYQEVMSWLFTIFNSSQVGIIKLAVVYFMASQISGSFQQVS